MGKKLISKKIFIFIIFISLFLMWTANSKDLPVLFNKVAENSSLQKESSASGERISVCVDFSLIHPANIDDGRVQASVPDKTIILRKDRVDERGKNDYTWFGNVEGRRFSSAVITVVKGIMYGHIDINGDSYSVFPDNGNYLVVKHDTDKMLPFDYGAKVPDIRKESEENGAFGYAFKENGSRIDVLVLYTRRMLKKYGKKKINALIQNFVDIANRGYANSNINTRLNLVHTELYGDSEAGESVDIDSALDYITNDTVISGIRNTYKADLISLLRVHKNVGSSCGLGWIMQDVNKSFADYAISVVEVRSGKKGGYYCDKRTFAHELGHNMGCVHDRNNASSQGAYFFSYGYGKDGKFGTIMSYIKPIITFFSTPKRTYKSYKIGRGLKETNPAFNALTINRTKETVANFRISAK